MPGSKWQEAWEEGPPVMEHRQTPSALRRHEVSRPREQQISGWFLLATSGTPEWEEPLGLCCSQAHFLLASPLRFSRPLPLFSLPGSLRPALVDGFAAPVSQIGRSWSFSRLPAPLHSHPALSSDPGLGAADPRREPLSLLRQSVAHPLLPRAHIWPRAQFSQL